jgi:hypothetical protein
MFDTVSGLPVHVLVVHAVVVLLPLMAVLTVVVAAVRRWRAPAVRWVIAGDALILVAALVAAQSGEKLQDRLSQAEGAPVAEAHAELGDLAPVFGVALLVAAVVVYLAVRYGGVLVPVSIALAVVVAVASIVWVVLVGHSGVQAVWKDEIAGTSAPVGAGGN